MPARKSKKWQSRRKPSLGQLRRAHPASGATWNVQVVRGKMTSKCLWHACRALILGILLMLLGASMATIGYYADHLSIGHEIRGNATVRVKNESRGFHLNNLSYAGPIVMGFGGFIVVAACVMTFEARDSAAKVVPARFKISSSTRSNIKSNSSSGTSNRRANGIMHQATRWDHHLGVFRTSPAEPPAPLQPIDRQALTAALIHFSKTLGNSPRHSPKTKRFSLSGSVPNLSSTLNSNRSSINSAQLSPLYRRQLITNTNTNSLTSKQFIFQQQQLLLQQQQQHHHRIKHHHHNHHHRRHHHMDEMNGDDCSKSNDNDKILNNNFVTSGNGSGIGNCGSNINNNNNNKNGKKNRTTFITTNKNGELTSFSKSRSSRTSTSLINRPSRGIGIGDTNSGSLLHPGKLHQMHRHAMSVDDTGPYYNTSDIDESSLMSIIMLDSSHEQRIKNRNRRSDTAKRHILSRQKPIEKEEQNNGQQNSTIVSARFEERRRSSTASDASYASRCYRASTTTSRTNSIDSRSIQVELHSPEKQQQQQQLHYYQNRMSSPRSPRRKSSISSIDREFRSQPSICSEPSIVIRQLSGQSNLEPCVLEESPESEEKDRTELENRLIFDKTSMTSLNTISANIKDEIHSKNNNNNNNNNKTKNNNTCESPIYCNIKKQRPQSLKISSNHFQINRSKKNSADKENIKSKTTTKTIDEKTKNIVLHRSNSSRTFYHSKPKLINEYEIVNRSAEDGSNSIGTSYINYYNSCGIGKPCTDDDFYDSLRVISERRNKILKTESESNSQYKTKIENVIVVELNEKENNDEILSNKENEINKIKIISNDNLDKSKCNSLYNVVSSKEENLNIKETDDVADDDNDNHCNDDADDNIKENLVQMTITTTQQPPNLLTTTTTTNTTTKTTTIPITTTAFNTFPLNSENNGETSSQSLLVNENLTLTPDTMQKTTNSNNTNSNCDSSSSTSNIKNKDNYCNNSKNQINSNVLPISICSTEITSESKTKNIIKKIENETESIILSPISSLYHISNNIKNPESDNSKSNISIINDKDVCVILLDDNNKNTELKNVLKNGNTTTDDNKAITYDDNCDDIDDDDNNDKNSVNRIHSSSSGNECPKETRITIDENVN